MVKESSTGIVIIPAGNSWEQGYAFALDFYKKSLLDSVAAPASRTIVLGNCIGQGAAQWLEREVEKLSPLLLGPRLERWQDYLVKISGNSANLLSDFQRRFYLRTILQKLEAAQQLETLSNFWSDAAVFQQISRTVNDLRLAGFVNSTAIEALDSWSASANTELQQARRSDIFRILAVWQLVEADLFAGKKDFASCLVDLAEKELEPGGEVLLLGLEHLHQLELDALLHLAKFRKIYWVVSFAQASLERLQAQSESKIEILGSFPLISNERAPNVWVAHTPQEEIEAGGFWLRQELKREHIEQVAWVLPSEVRESRNLVESLEHGIGIEILASYPGDLWQRGPGRWLLQILELSRQEFPLFACLDILRPIVRFHWGEQGIQVLKKAAHSGIRGGLQEWRQFAENPEPEAKEIFSIILGLNKALPAQATPKKFYEALLQWFKRYRIADIALHNSENMPQGSMAWALETLLAVCENLAVEINEPISRTAWQDELREALELAQPQIPSRFGKIHLFTHGEWIPPLEKCALLISGLSTEYQHHHEDKILRDSARRELSAWGVLTADAQGLAASNWLQRLSYREQVAFSRARLNRMGEAIQASLALRSFSELQESALPNVNIAPPKEPVPRAMNALAVNIPQLTLHSISATFIERWQFCPFVALVDKVWRLEDTERPCELDLGSRERGTLLHRVLELFFMQQRALDKEKSLHPTLLEQCLDQAMGEMPWGNTWKSQELARSLRLQTLRFLQLAVAREVEYLEKFPNLKIAACEVPIDQELPGIGRLKGKIDRIDHDPQENAFLLIDYKSGGSLKTKDILNGRSFQIPLYIEAAKTLNYGIPAGGYALNLAKGERNNGLLRKDFNKAKKPEKTPLFAIHSANKSLLDEEKFTQALQNSLERAKEIVENIRAGNFSVAPDQPKNCERCEIFLSCRIFEKSDAESLPELSARKIVSEPLSINLVSRPQERNLEEKREINRPQFSGNQERALSVWNSLVFVEASAGSGKTTILVERFRRGLEKIAKERSLPIERAAERFLLISFTEKSRLDIEERLLSSLVSDYGIEKTERITKSVSTIHGFCSRVISRFGAKIGISPLARQLDEIAAQRLRRSVFFDLFGQSPNPIRESLDFLSDHFSRADLQKIVTELEQQRIQFNQEIAPLLESQTASRTLPFFPEQQRLQVAQNLLAVWREFQRLYALQKQSKQVLDFQDLEEHTLTLLREPEVAAFYQQQFDQILVDEFQDTNRIQCEIVEKISQNNFSNCFVVGDAKQSIYRFRKADVTVFEGIRALAANQGIICELSQNYRSGTKIVEFANRLSRNIFPTERIAERPFESVATEAHPARQVSGKVELLAYTPDETLARFNADTIAERRLFEAELIADYIITERARGRRFGEIALLLRRLTAVDTLLKSLSGRGIPFVLGGRGQFYSQPEILDGLIFLRAVALAESEATALALLRSPWFAIEASELANMRAAEGFRGYLHNAPEAAWFRNFQDLLPAVGFTEILRMAYELHPRRSKQSSRRQIRKFLEIVADMEIDLGPGLELIHELSRLVGWNGTAQGIDEASIPADMHSDAIQILTIHGSKGLQFPCVILSDMEVSSNDRSLVRFEPGLGFAIKSGALADKEDEEAEEFAALKAAQKLRDEAESKRLLYVAATRAKDVLLFVLPSAGKPEKKSILNLVWKTLEESPDLVERLEKNSEKDSGIQAPAPALATLEDKYFLAPDRMSACISVSMTELAAYAFCGEFYRKKFLLGWDQRVFLLATPAATEEYESSGSSVSRQIRGIAMHKLLEQTADLADLQFRGKAFLGDYLQTLVGPEGRSNLVHIVAEDYAKVEKFLKSDFGKIIFNVAARAWPEQPFHWRIGEHAISGTIDRIVALSENKWLIIDYKSALSDASMGRNQFQVQGYMRALETWLVNRGSQDFTVQGYLVNLETGAAHEVPLPDENWAEAELSGVIALRTKGYGQFGQKPLVTVKRTEACSVCAFFSHCTISQSPMVTFS